MSAVATHYPEVDEEDWVSVPSQPNLKRKADGNDQRTGVKSKPSASPLKASSDELADDCLYQTLKAKTGGAPKPPGFDALMQSQYFGATGEALGSGKDDMSLLTAHPVTGGGMHDPLDELFGDEGRGYLQEDEPSEPSEPCSPGLSLESSLIEELEDSVSKADSANIAVAFASIARKSTEKGRPTIISMRLVPKSKTGGLVVDSVDGDEPKKVYNRVSVVGPIDLADPDEVARVMSQNSQNAYLVTECHPGPDLEDFTSLTKDMQSDLLWNWSVFREDNAKDDIESQEEPRSDKTGRKEFLLGDLLQNSLLFPIAKKIFWERYMPILVTTHVISVLVGVVIGRRLSLPAQDRR